jgi:pimeloyl-ACP methyl ester carboxylesterase
VTSLAAVPRTAIRPMTPGVLGALAVATSAADEVVLATVRDVHAAVGTRAFGLTNAATGGLARLPAAVHRGISTAVYTGVGASLRATGWGLREADRRGVSARLEASRGGRRTVSAFNGLIGDRLAEQQSDLAIDLAVRAGGRDVPLDTHSLAAAFPDATPALVVFLHGLVESESAWDHRSDQFGGSYGSRLAADTSWTPVYLRANTGLPIAENAVALASLLDDLVVAWPVGVRRIALVGHSMGGLILRAACSVDPDGPWNALVTDVVTLGTPHLGAPLERGVALAARTLGGLPESAPFGRILEYRSAGILDLRAGLAADVRNLPHARYRLVGATLAGSPRHPVSELVGDLLVRYASATGRPRRGPEMFPGADTLHVRGDHFDLLNHPTVYAALRTWLA